MKRFIVVSWVVLVVLLLGGLVVPALAAPPGKPLAEARIDQPKPNAVARGVVKVIGTATRGDFQRYEIYYGVGANPSPLSWVFVAAFNAPVVNGLLYEWNTVGLPDGIYTLRLRAVSLNAQYDEAVVTVRVDNTSTPTPTATATETPVPPATPTPFVTVAPAITVVPTSTPAPTPTPGSLLPLPQDWQRFLDIQMWLRPFLGGIAVAGGILLLAALIALIRAVLR
jgi:hypothetical protein